MDTNIQMSLKWLGREKKCHLCGKRFLGSEDAWRFKRTQQGISHILYFCSWSCIRKWDAEMEAKRKKGRKRCPQEQEIYRLLAEKEQPKLICERLGINRSTYWYYRERWVEQQEDEDSE